MAMDGVLRWSAGPVLQSLLLFGGNRGDPDVVTLSNAPKNARACVRGPVLCVCVRCVLT